jgi:hypothetical protein
MSGDQERTARILDRLRARLGEEGLHVVLPLAGAAFDGVAGASGPLRLGALLHDARGALLVGDGGADFFARFQEAARETGLPFEAENPLDDFTRRRVQAAVEDVLRPNDVAFGLFFPFGVGSRPLPFQRLGQAAGLPAPGPLGVQVHPVFGPWWAYRALVVVALPIDADASLAPSCAGCDQPCVRACPTHGADRTESARSGAAPPPPDGIEPRCTDSCGARLRCPVGGVYSYPAAPIAFHLRARDALMRVRA